VLMLMLAKGNSAMHRRASAGLQGIFLQCYLLFAC